MKLTIVQPNDVPEPLRKRFGAYDAMFRRMFEGEDFAFETLRLSEGDALPDPEELEAVLITGSPAGVYDTHIAWMAPLGDFIRAAYEARTPMAGICFGHQIMAQALGGDVRKSDKGWGLGRHVYRVVARPELVGGTPEFAIACSHQRPLPASSIATAPPSACSRIPSSPTTTPPRSSISAAARRRTMCSTQRWPRCSGPPIVQTWPATSRPSSRPRAGHDQRGAALHPVARVCF
jgi:GMP synthase-like glutamine amidotransferase